MNNDDASSWNSVDTQEVPARSDSSTSTDTCSTSTNNHSTKDNPRRVERRRADNKNDLPLQGILRQPSIAKRQLSVTAFPPIVERPWWYLWKHGSLAIIPIVGYILSQLYPSSMLLHFTFLCFIYGVVDLIDQDPNFSILSTITNSAMATTTQDLKLFSGGTMDHYRLRRVEFVDGTKFYRMPKPMTRKQKQAYRDYRFQNAVLTIQQQQQERGSGISGPCSDPTVPPSSSLGMDKTCHPPSHGTTTTTILDWETTTQRLKSILEPRHLPEDLSSSRDLDFEDAQQTEITNSNPVDPSSSSSSSSSSAMSLLLEENIDPLKRSFASLASSKLIGGDSPIARLRMATKPLQPVNQPQQQ